MEQVMIEKLIDTAIEQLKFSYTPYSNFKVGAALLAKNGEIFTGCNIENASYGLTNCAERSAVFAAYSLGYRKEDIEMIAIVSDGEKLAAPCGACRQVLVELLDEDTPIILSNHKEEKVTNIKELLPMSFTSEDVL